MDAAEQQAAKKQLETMLAHPLFQNARRLSSLLRYLVEEVLEGRGDCLKEYTLGVAALNRGSGFDPRLDSIVRVEASKLRKRLQTYYKEAAVHDPILTELPRGSYAPSIETRARSQTALSPTIGSVAVLPFVYLGPELDGEYLSDGLTEEIIERLGTIPGMRVVARTSSFQFKDKAGQMQEIGRALRAEHLIEGSVRRMQNGFRVNARLINSETGYRVWSRTYDKTLDSFLGIQVQIAEAIGTTLAGQKFLATDSLVTRPLAPEAYKLYLRGRFHRNQWTLQGFEKSVDCFQQALSLEPQSAQILAVLAEVETNRALSGRTPTVQQFAAPAPMPNTHSKMKSVARRHICPLAGFANFMIGSGKALRRRSTVLSK